MDSREEEVLTFRDGRLGASPLQQWTGVRVGGHVMSPVSSQPSRPGEREREECKTDAIKQDTFVQMLLHPSSENRGKFFVQYQKRRGMDKVLFGICPERGSLSFLERESPEKVLK